MSNGEATLSIQGAENPTINDILDRFVLLYYWSSSTKDAKNVCKRIIKEFNKLTPAIGLYDSHMTTDSSCECSEKDMELSRWRDVYLSVYRNQYEKLKKDASSHRNEEDACVSSCFGESLFRKMFKDIYAVVHSETNGKVAKSVLGKMYDELTDENSIVFKTNFDSLLADQREVISSGKRRGAKRSRATQESSQVSLKENHSLVSMQSTISNNIDSIPVPKRVKLEDNTPQVSSNGPVDRIVVWAQPESNDAEEEEVDGEEGVRGSVARDETAKREEEFGMLFFEVVKNDGTIRSLEKLLALKNIFGRQLPKMPKDYMSRLVFDHNHRSMIGYKGNRVVGGITFRPFFEQGFGEIAFCAIIGTEQVKGYGTRLMNHLKDYCQGIRVFRFLTYADNHATNYFKKQGFSKEITLDETKYKGFIKDYDGGTLMECVLRPQIPYLDVPGMLRQQRAAVYEKMKEISNSHIVHPGLEIFKEGGKITSVDQIPGLREAGFKDEDVGVSGAANEKSKKQQKILRKVLAQLQDHDDSWPFLQPVDRDAVPDYYDVIKEPIDLSTIESRLEDNYYRTHDIFVSDLRLMFNNCRTYNRATTPYYKCADTLERFFKETMKRVLSSLR